MKTKIFVCLSFALFGLTIQGCGPETRINGVVREDQTGMPVADAAVLGMVWIEDGDKAQSAPDTRNLKSEDRDTALDKDMKDRGLPAAYARNFTDSNGRFELDNFHFSADTKKAVNAMKQPKITRVTIWAFQRGYRKQAVTMFPKNHNKEMPAAAMLLARPADWKELYVDNIVDTLTQDYMLKGYSKEFGATKAEKSWIFEYTRANEQQAYDTSNIKGDKKMEEMCGRDYSDIIVSTAGIQRNPAREKCGELIKRIGAIHEVEELWLAHSNMKQDPLAAAKEAVSQALNTLSAETAEPKEYEAMILAGLEAAGKMQSKDAIRNGVNGNAWQDEAKLLYGKGDKAAAYRAMGYALYNHLPKEIGEGVITVQLLLRIIPSIKETAAGFYLLMNKPLMAQLPNGDNGNHKDKLGYKVEGGTETAEALKNKDSLGGDTREAAQTSKSKQRIEELFKNSHKLLRFHNKDGKRLKDINLDSKETRMRISKEKTFDASNFKLKTSPQMAEIIEETRKNFGRDVELYRQEFKEVYYSSNRQFVVVEDGYLDFLDFADASDGERSEEAADVERITTVYDQDGNKVLELSKTDGHQPIVSNTGQFFVVTMGEYGKHRITNKKKEVLVEMPYHRGNKFFSASDNYVLLENQLAGSDRCEWTIYDTKQKKLELRKFILSECSGDTNTIEILENKKEVIMRHEWDTTTKRWFVSPTIERIQF